VPPYIRQYVPRNTERYIQGDIDVTCQSQWPRGLRHWSTAARLLRSWVHIPPGHQCLSVVCVVCFLSGRVLCDELITRPEDSYRLWRVVVCDQESCKRGHSPGWAAETDNDDGDDDNNNVKYINTVKFK
jgi:hypothetical protein